MKLFPKMFNIRGEALAHNVGTSGNIDVRGKGIFEGQQYIINKNTGLYDRSPENTGTYDYELPGLPYGYKNHNIMDVDPWLVWGNSPQDTTTPEQRLNSLTDNGSYTSFGNIGFKKYIQNNNSLYGMYQYQKKLEQFKKNIQPTINYTPVNFNNK